MARSQTSETRGPLATAARLVGNLALLCSSLGLLVIVALFFRACAAGFGVARYVAQEGEPLEIVAARGQTASWQIFPGGVSVNGLWAGRTDAFTLVQPGTDRPVPMEFTIRGDNRISEDQAGITTHTGAEEPVFVEGSITVSDAPASEADTILRAELRGMLSLLRHAGSGPYYWLDRREIAVPVTVRIVSIQHAADTKPGQQKTRWRQFYLSVAITVGLFLFACAIALVGDWVSRAHRLGNRTS